MRKLISIIFILIISIQCLPIKEMGKCLFDNQFVEEEVCKGGMEKAKNFQVIKDVAFTEFNMNFINLVDDHIARRKTALHKPPITDIVAPPPNA